MGLRISLLIYDDFIVQHSYNFTDQDAIVDILDAPRAKHSETMISLIQLTRFYGTAV